MPDQEDERRLFETYTSDVASILDIEAAAAEERSRLDGAVRHGVDAALVKERNIRDESKDITRRALALDARVGRLLARTSVAPSTDPTTAQPPRSVRELGAALAALESDVAAAESSWSWVERAVASSSGPTPQAAPQGHPADRRAERETDVPPTSTGRPAWVLPALVALIAALVIVLVVVLTR